MNQTQKYIIDDLKIDRDFAKDMVGFYRKECKDPGLEDVYEKEYLEYVWAIEILTTQWKKLAR